MIDFSDVNVKVIKGVYEELAYGGEPLDSYFQIGNSGWGCYNDEKQVLYWLEDNGFIHPSLNFDDEKCEELERFFEENEI